MASRWQMLTCIWLRLGRKMWVTYSRQSRQLRFSRKNRAFRIAFVLSCKCSSYKRIRHQSTSILEGLPTRIGHAACSGRFCWSLRRGTVMTAMNTVSVLQGGGGWGLAWCRCVLLWWRKEINSLWSFHLPTVQKYCAWLFALPGFLLGSCIFFPITVSVICHFISWGM